MKERQNFNLLVGRRLRDLRMTRGLTQKHLAEALGQSYQAVQKYESGASRIAPDKLMRLAGEFGVPVSYFFEEAPAPNPNGPHAALMHVMRSLSAIEKRRPQLFEALCGLAAAIAALDE